MKNKLIKGLSLSVNPKHSISERFKASTRGFRHFKKKFESERNILFSVILGFIPRIHTKHLANVILGFIPRIHAKHSPLDTRVKPEYDRDLMVDTRVTPEYDGKKRMCLNPENDYKQSLIKGLDVVRQCAALLERLKTHIKINSLFCHPRAWLLARPEDLDSRVKPENDHNNLLPQCAPDATGFLSDVYKRGTRAQKFLADGVQCGRSMIEMLGVLAIIEVLSVGGIAGYTKAMEKIHVNKMIGEYNMLIYGLLEYKDSIISNVENVVDLNNVVKQLNLVPETWKVEGTRLNDGLGNLIYPYAAKKRVYGGTEDRIVVDFNLGGLNSTSGHEISSNFSDKLCFEIFNSMLLPLHNVIDMAWLYRDGTAGSTKYYGDKICGNDKKCLKDMTFAEIKTLCNLCDKENQRCNVTLYIK